MAAFATPIPYPLVNGLRCDFSSVVIDIAGEKYNAVKSISYKHTLDPGIVRGNRAQVIGRTRGKYDAEGSIELYLAEFNDVIAKLGTLGRAQGLGYLEQQFQIVVSYAEGPTSALFTDRLAGCRIKSTDRSPAEGNEPVTVKCELHVMYLSEHGQQPIGGEQLLKL